MERKGTSKRQRPAAQAERSAVPGRPLGDADRSLAELRAEIEAEGLDPDDELRKMRALGPAMAARLAANEGARHAAILAPTFAPQLAIRYPRFMEAVAAGAPQWCEAPEQDGEASADDLMGRFDPASCSWARVKGMSMRDAGIVDGTYVLVDRKTEPSVGDIVLVWLQAEGQVVKRLDKEDGAMVLRSANPSFKDIVVRDEQTIRIHGVVRGAVSRFQ